MKKGWLSDQAWQAVQQKLPICCVDVLLTKRARSGISAVGLIHRHTPHQGCRWCASARSSIPDSMRLPLCFRLAFGDQSRRKARHWIFGGLISNGCRAQRPLVSVSKKWSRNASGASPERESFARCHAGAHFRGLSRQSPGIPAINERRMLFGITETSI